MKLSKEALLKRNETRKVAKAKLDSQKFAVGGGWSVERMDCWNRGVFHNGKHHGYYGSCSDALRSIPAKMLDAEEMRSLAEVVERINQLRELIEDALRDAGLRAKLAEEQDTQ
jgi:hypothetical protein